MMNSSYFLVWIYILGGMILKMKKFVIPWRKFESKMSYINEDMNFSIFWNFLDFILIFQEFLGFISLLKMQK